MFFLFFFCQLWFYMLQSLTMTLIKNLKDVFTEWQTGVTEEVNRYVPWGWPLTTNAKEKRGQRGSRWDKFDFWVYVDIECSHTHLPKTKQKKAPDFRHPDEVLKSHTMQVNVSLMVMIGSFLTATVFLCNVSSSRFRELLTKPQKEEKENTQSSH